MNPSFFQKSFTVNQKTKIKNIQIKSAIFNTNLNFAISSTVTNMQLMHNFWQKIMKNITDTTKIRNSPIQTTDTENEYHFKISC